MDNEEWLTGGNVNNVYRSGHTVRREQQPNSHRIHRLLKHLENKKFSYAPKYYGIDEKGREILSYIEGEAGNYPLQTYMWSDDALTGIARMLRHYHDAVSDFTFDDDWHPLDLTPEPKEVICHNDFAIYNIIFKNNKPAGIIDFDVAAPGPRGWDAAYTLYTCCPLSRFYVTPTGEKVYYKSNQHADRIKRRVQLFNSAYGESFDDSLEMVVLRLEGLCKTMRRKAEEGVPAFQKMIKEGHLEHYQQDIQFVRKHKHEWM